MLMYAGFPRVLEYLENNKFIFQVLWKKSTQNKKAQE